MIFTLYVLSCIPLVPLDAQARSVHHETSSFGPALKVNLVEGAVLFRTSPFCVSGSSFDKDVLRLALLLEVARERLLDSCRVSRLPCILCDYSSPQDYVSWMSSIFSLIHLFTYGKC